MTTIQDTLQELKDIFVSLIKAPTTIPLVVAFVLANQKWLFPNVPNDVMQSFLNLFTAVLVAVSVYYAGKTVQQLKVDRLVSSIQPLNEHMTSGYVYPANGGIIGVGNYTNPTTYTNEYPKNVTTSQIESHPIPEVDPAHTVKTTLNEQSVFSRKS